MTQSPIGTEIDGRYRLERELGRGASGVVYAARQLAVDRLVAIKLLSDSEDPGFKKRFEIEARAVGRLNHPSIITLHDFGWSDEVETYFMVTELIDGESLADRMMQYMSTDLILHVCLETASALHHAHGQGILHRDLKPENIMLIEGEARWPTVKVLDFGLARMFSAAEEAQHEQDENAESDSEEDQDAEAKRPRIKPPVSLKPPPILQEHVEPQIQGTPAYMSPEQARGRQDLDAKTDLYSLGVVLFELLEGHPPFDSADRQELLELHISGDIPEQQWEETPEEVHGLIVELLQKAPEDRPGSALDVVNVLEFALGRESSIEQGADDHEWTLEPLSETSEAGLYDSEEPAAEPVDDFSDLDVAPPSGKKRTIAAVAMIVIVLIVGLIVMMSASDDPEEDLEPAATAAQPQPSDEAPAEPDPEPAFAMEFENKDPAAAGREVSRQSHRAISIAKTAADARVQTLEKEGKLKKKKTRKKKRRKEKEKKPRLRELKLSL